MVPELRTETVDTPRLKRRSEAIAETLGDVAPRIETHRDRPGLFWLDVSGLDELYNGWSEWIETLRKRLRNAHDVYVCVVIGFRRFSTFAIVRHTRRSGAFHHPESERARALKVPLCRLGLHPSSQQTFRRLGVHTVGELLELPPEGLRRRLGDRIFELVRLARGDLDRPHPTHHSSDHPTRVEHLDDAVGDTHRLLFLIKRSLSPLLETLEQKSEKLRAVVVVLHRRDTSSKTLTIRPAEPTVDESLVVDLIRLRLERLAIDDEITDIVVTAHGEDSETEQLHLFDDRSRRDIDAANRALARLKSQFGSHAVMRIAPAEAHLPESRFELVSLDTLALPDVDEAGSQPAIRRFFPTPIHLRRRPDLSCGTGPHTICGGWWIRKIHRDYYLISTGDRLQWVFYDHRRQRWYRHGEC